MPGVQMQFIAKSGGNRYRGTLYADYENRAWQSFNIDEDQITRGAQGGGGAIAARCQPSVELSRRQCGYRRIHQDGRALVVFLSSRTGRVGARQVNFPVKPHRTHVTNYTGKGTYQVTPNNTLVAFGQAGRNHQPNRLDPSGLSGLTATTAINEAEESTTEQLAWGWMWKGEWNSVISDKAFFEVRVGAVRRRPSREAERLRHLDSRMSTP